MFGRRRNCQIGYGRIIVIGKPLLLIFRWGGVLWYVLFRLNRRLTKRILVFIQWLNTHWLDIEISLSIVRMVLHCNICFLFLESNIFATNLTIEYIFYSTKYRQWQWYLQCLADIHHWRKYQIRWIESKTFLLMCYGIASWQLNAGGDHLGNAFKWNVVFTGWDNIYPL